MKVRVGTYVFDHADYDESRDEIWLSAGRRAGAVDEEIADNEFWFTTDDGDVVGLEVHDVRSKIERDGGFFITLPSGERIREPEIERFVAERAAS